MWHKEHQDAETFEVATVGPFTLLAYPECFVVTSRQWRTTGSASSTKEAQFVAVCALRQHLAAHRGEEIDGDRVDDLLAELDDLERATA